MSVKQLSREEFRKQYLASLELENRNAAKNLEANKLFIQTGQPTPVTDTRTITEKLADVEGLKTLLLTELRKITDSTSASDIISKLSGDTETLKFLYQNFGAIERDIKPRFRSGVPSDIFIPYLRKYMERFEQTQGVDVPVTAETIVEALGEAEESKAIIKEAAEGDKSLSSLGVKRNAKEYPIGERNLMRAHFNVMKSRLPLVERREEDPAQKEEIKRVLKEVRTPNKYNSANKVWANFTTEGAELWTEMYDIANMLVPASESAPTTGKGIKGKGLARPAITLSVSVPKGMKKSPPADFGRYKIDTVKLADSIISLKHPCGKAVCEIPNKRVNKNVLSVVRTLVGGELPSYDQLEVLGDEDRLYLNDLVKKSKLNDKVKIPTPNKDKLEKEMNRFEILRGQILAGNDSKELVKEFKHLLVKFGNQGRVPKKEVNDILYELLAYGL